MATPAAIELALPVTPLTDEQKKIVAFVYDSAKTYADGILNHPTLSSALKITQLMGAIMKLLENLTFNQMKLSGPTKKAVAIELGRSLIRDLIKDDSIKEIMLPLYDTMAEPLLETLVDVSHTLNTAAKEAAASCCEWMAAFIKK
jgi:hypothetical protein